MRFGLLFLVLGFLTLRAEPVPSGAGRLVFEHAGEELTIFTYKPASYRNGPLLVVFHGVARNAEEYRDFARQLADRFHALVVVPWFDKDRFPSWRYQRGGVLDAKGRPQPAERWTYAAIPRLVGMIREREGRPDLPHYLIGHSAGGQFLVRLAAFLPGEARRIVAANPGSLLFPDRTQTFGYGFGGLPAEWAGDEALRRYLAAPLTLYLGTGDITPEHSFDDSPAGMRQGPNRLARGRAAYAAAEKLARERGWVFGWRKVETPGIGHEARRMFAAAEAEAALFGTP